MVVDDVDGPLGGEHLLHGLHLDLAARGRAVPWTVVQVDQHACAEKRGLLSHLHKGCLIPAQRKGRLWSPIGPPLAEARVPGSWVLQPVQPPAYATVGRTSLPPPPVSHVAHQR